MLKKRFIFAGLLIHFFILIALSNNVWAQMPKKGEIPKEFLPSSPPAPPPVSLDEVLRTADANAKIPVIVQFQSPLKDNDYNQLEQRIGAFGIKYKYSVIPGMAAKLTKGQINALSRMPIVHSIEYDNLVYAFLDSATQWFGTDDVTNDFGLTGTSITIVIIDTGIDYNHIDLDSGKVIAWMDYVNGQPYPYDDHGHGTHVASIAAGTGEGNSAYTGVAPDAALIGLKVLNSAGIGPTSDVIDAVNWCVANKNTYGIRVMNLSLGVGINSDGQDGLSAACNNAMDAGIVVVVAAGNYGPATYTISSPGAAEKVVTVGAMADIGKKGLFQASFSSRGPTADNRIKPDVSAPGYMITAALKGSTSGYTIKSGTSMAAPFVAGVAALILQDNPGLTPSQVKSRIMSTSQDWAGPGLDIDYGAGKLDSYRAVSTSTSKPVLPTHSYVADSLPATGSSDYWDINVTDIAYPIAITLIMPDWGLYGHDFDIYLYRPTGSLVDYSGGVKRQETIDYLPTVTGTYKLRVRSYSGSGPYFFDLSAGTGATGDTTPPVTTISLNGTLGANGWYISDVTATLTATDNDSGVDKTEYSFDGSTWNTYTAPSIIPTEGENTVYYRSVDNEGNFETAKTQEVKIDKTPPASVYDLAAGNPTDNSIELTWTAPSDNVSGTASYDVRYSTATITESNWVTATPATGEPTPGSPGASESFVVTGLVSATTYYFALKTTDVASQVSDISNVTSEITTAPDNDPPVIANATGDTSGTTGESITISATITDYTDVSSATIYYTPIGGSETTTPMTEGVNDVWTGYVPCASNKVGLIPYYITASDPSNNTARDPSSGSYNITVTDDDAPVISGVASSDITSSSATITWTTDEPSDSVVNYGTSSPPGQPASDAAMVTSHSVTLSGLTSNTLYYYEVQSTDASGNTGTDDNGGAYYTFTTQAASSVWSSGDLEMGVWSVSGTSSTSSDANKVYSFNLPNIAGIENISVTVGVLNYDSSGSQKVDSILPYLQVWTYSGTDLNQIDTDKTPVAPGDYIFESETVILDITPGALNKIDVWIRSLNKRNKRQMDVVEVDKVIVEITYSGSSVAPGLLVEGERETETELLQNYENPFNPETWIPYKLAEPANVTIRIYDVTGRLIRTLSLGNKQAGGYVSRDRAAYWDGRNEYGEQVSSGVYFYVMEAGAFRAAKRMFVVR